MKVPAYWKSEVAAILISPKQLASRIKTLAAKIETDYSDKDLVVVALLNGTVVFLSDLIRHLSLPLKLDFIGVSSYRSGSTTRKLIFTKDLALDVKGRHVLLVDDILDTGKTIDRVTRKLNRLKPASVKTCVLLNKQARRVVPVEADYIGFNIPDEFVVGYGLDYAERFRNLPFVGVLKPSVFAK